MKVRTKGMWQTRMELYIFTAAKNILCEKKYFVEEKEDFFKQFPVKGSNCFYRFCCESKYSPEIICQFQVISKPD